MRRKNAVSKSPATGEKRLQCRAVESQTISAEARDLFIEWCRKAEAERIAWAEHPAEGDKPAHFHLCARWNRTVDCLALRKAVQRLDPHGHTDKVGRWTNCVRYLRHLDQTDKVRIPPESAHYEGFPEDELAAVSSEGCDNLALVQMIANIPHGSSAVEALRVCIGAGYRPSEISGVTRALYDLKNLLTDGGRVGVKRMGDCGGSRAPSARPRGPVLVFDPYDPDPGFFASPDELDATVPCLDVEA